MIQEQPSQDREKNPYPMPGHDEFFGTPEQQERAGQIAASVRNNGVSWVERSLTAREKDSLDDEFEYKVLQNRHGIVGDVARVGNLQTGEADKLQLDRFGADEGAYGFVRQSDEGLVVVMELPRLAMETGKASDFPPTRVTMLIPGEASDRLAEFQNDPVLLEVTLQQLYPQWFTQFRAHRWNGAEEGVRQFREVYETDRGFTTREAFQWGVNETINSDDEAEAAAREEAEQQQRRIDRGVDVLRMVAQFDGLAVVPGLFQGNPDAGICQMWKRPPTMDETAAANTESVLQLLTRVTGMLDDLRNDPDTFNEPRFQALAMSTRLLLHRLEHRGDQPAAMDIRNTEVPTVDVRGEQRRVWEDEQMYWMYEQSLHAVNPEDVADGESEEAARQRLMLEAAGYTNVDEQAQVVAALEGGVVGPRVERENNQPHRENRIPSREILPREEYEASREGLANVQRQYVRDLLVLEYMQGQNDITLSDELAEMLEYYQIKLQYQRAAGVDQLEDQDYKTIGAQVQEMQQRLQSGDVDSVNDELNRNRQENIDSPEWENLPIGLRSFREHYNREAIRLIVIGELGNERYQQMLDQVEAGGADLETLLRQIDAMRDVRFGTENATREFIRRQVETFAREDIAFRMQHEAMMSGDHPVDWFPEDGDVEEGMVKLYGMMAQREATASEDQRRRLDNRIGALHRWLRVQNPGSEQLMDAAQQAAVEYNGVGVSDKQFNAYEQMADRLEQVRGLGGVDIRVALEQIVEEAGTANLPDYESMDNSDLDDILSQASLHRPGAAARARELMGSKWVAMGLGGAAVGVGVWFLLNYGLLFLYGHAAWKAIKEELGQNGLSI